MQLDAERAAGTERVHDPFANRLARRGLLGARVALVGIADSELLAHEQARIRLERDALAIAERKRRHVHPGGKQAPRALVEHEGDRRIDELHGARRAGRIVGGAVRVLAAGGPRRAIRVQHAAQFQAVHLCAMPHQGLPARRPAQLAHQLARQAERKIEAADPRPGPLQEGFETREVFYLLNFFNMKGIPIQDSRSDRDRLGLARRAGEVDAVDPQRRSPTISRAS